MISVGARIAPAGRVWSNPKCALPGIAQKKFASVVARMCLSPECLRQEPSPPRILAQRNPDISLQQTQKTAVAARIHVTMETRLCLWQAQACLQRQMHSTGLHREDLSLPAGCFEHFTRRAGPTSQPRIASRTEQALCHVVHIALCYEFALHEAFVIQGGSGNRAST